MPLLFRTVKYSKWTFPFYAGGLSSINRTIIHSNERVFDVDKEDENMINYVASILVTAEQHLCYANHLFVSVFEIEEGEKVDINKNVHVLFNNRRKTTKQVDGYNTGLKEVVHRTLVSPYYTERKETIGYEFAGCRTATDAKLYGNNSDPFLACHVLFECETGVSRKNMYMSSLEKSDYYFTQSGTLKLQPENSLQKYRFKNFADTMSLLTPLMKGYYMDKFGVLRKGEDMSGGITLSCISDLRIQRRREVAKQNAETYNTEAFVVHVEAYNDLLNKFEFDTCNHLHSLPLMNWDERNLRNIIQFQKEFYTILKQMTTQEPLNPPYGFYYLQCKNGVFRGASKVTPNKTKIQNIAKSYVDFWEPIYNGLLAFDFPRETFAGYVPSENARWGFPPEAEITIYGTTGNPPRLYVESNIWYVELYQNNKLDRYTKLAERYMLTLINTAKFCKVFALYEKFFNYNLPKLEHIKGVTVKGTEAFNMSVALERSGVGRKGVATNGVRSTELTRKAVNDSYLSKKLFYYMNAPGFCPLEIDMYLPSPTEGATAHVFTVDKRPNKSIACDNDLHIQIGLFQGGSRNVNIKNGKVYVRQVMNSIYHHTECVDSDRVETEGKNVNPGFQFGDFNPLTIGRKLAGGD